MIRKFDHVTAVVRDLDAARKFFGLLGFAEIKAVVISGKVMEDYMGVSGIEADHVTLAIENPHTEVQLLHYRHPEAIADPHIRQLNKIGFNHICFSVDDLEAEIAKAHRRRREAAQQDDGLPQPQACLPGRSGRHHH